MCPVNHIKGLEKWSGIDDVTAIYRVKRGSAVHKELQQDLLQSKSLYDPPGNISDPRIKSKLTNNWPEVPFHDFDSRLSGSVDCVLNFRGQPLPGEIKTTNIDPERWEQHQKTLPMPNHLCQASIYCYELLKLNYYPGKEIKNFLLIYLNLLYPPGDQKAEKEYLLEYDAPKTEHLVQELTKNMNQYISGEEMICQYQLCKIHNTM
jgi:hypothetical protein